MKGEIYLANVAGRNGRNLRDNDWYDVSDGLAVQILI